MTAKVVNITLLSLSMLSTLTVSSQGVEIKRPKFHNSIHTERYLSPSDKVSDYLYYDDSEGYTDYTHDVLGRTTAIRKAGEVWKNHPCKISYSTNDSDEVKRYCLEDMESQVITPLGFYAEGSLRVTTTENEDGRKLSIYTDRDGKKILERRGPDNDTYFVYDNFDRLRAVLMPGYQTNPDLQQQAYLYQYDLVGNMISKTLPGCSPIRYWYDCHNRCIAEQDGELLKRGGLYRFKLYDCIGRIAIVGITETDPSNILNGFVKYEENVSGISCTNYSELVSNTINITVNQIETINYYDDYKFLSGSFQDKFGGLRASTNSKSKGKISGKLTGQSDGQFLVPSTLTAYLVN